MREMRKHDEPVGPVRWITRSGRLLGQTWSLNPLLTLALIFCIFYSLKRQSPADQEDYLSQWRSNLPSSSNTATLPRDKLVIIGVIRLFSIHGFGGMAQVASDRWAYGIQHLNWEVHVITSAPRNKTTPLEYITNGIHVHHVAKGTPTLASEDFQNGAIEYIEFLRTNRSASIVHMDSKPLSDARCLYLRELGLKVGITWHGTNYDNLRTILSLAALGNGHTPMKIEDEVQYTLGGARALRTLLDYQVAVAPQSATDLLDVYHIPRNRVFTIPNGISEISDMATRHDVRTLYKLPMDALIILYAGRFNHEKGAHTFLEAVESILASREPDLKSVYFLVAAAGDLYGEAESMASKHPNRFILLGSLSHADLLGLYSSAHILIDPSIHYNALNMVGLEAMCFDVRVILADVERVRSVFGREQQDLVTFEPGDAVALFHAMKKIIAQINNGESATLAKKLRTRWCQFFSMSNSVKQYDQMFRMLMQDQRPSKMELAIDHPLVR